MKLLKSMRLVLLFSPVFFVVSGCSTLSPAIHDFNVVPAEKELQMSQTMQTEIAKQMSINTDPSLNRAVNTIGSRLVSALPKKDYEYKFFVVNDPSPNAFTIPGGKIYVHTGLMSFVSDPDELAGVIAHEIGHAYEKHPAKGVSRGIGLQTLTSVFIKDAESNRLKQAVLGLAQNGILNKYGRDDEREADDVGYYLLKRAGYKTDGLLRFLKKLEKISGNKTPVFFSTHPQTPERIARLESLANQSRAFSI